MAGVMALAGPTKVIMFEPLPVNQIALKRLCELNPNLPLEVMPFAIGNSDDAAQLTILLDTSMAKLSTSKFQPETASDRRTSVDIRRIDTLVSTGTCPPPNVIKIDVEGAEIDVLRGARSVLKRARPIIFLEAHSGELEEECSREMTNLNYLVRPLYVAKPEQQVPRHLVFLPK